MEQLAMAREAKVPQAALLSRSVCHCAEVRMCCWSTAKALALKGQLGTSSLGLQLAGCDGTTSLAKVRPHHIMLFPHIAFLAVLRS